MKQSFKEARVQNVCYLYIPLIHSECGYTHILHKYRGFFRAFSSGPQKFPPVLGSRHGVVLSRRSELQTRPGARQRRGTSKGAAARGQSPPASCGRLPSKSRPEPSLPSSTPFRKPPLSHGVRRPHLSRQAVKKGEEAATSSPVTLQINTGDGPLASDG